ncbi:hypothetical protein [Shewanella psychrotolerans]|nr:hypothetical protein [Shewanella psychrotolerans]
MNLTKKQSWSLVAMLVISAVVSAAIVYASNNIDAVEDAIG